ncbi:MAG: hypothetical protein ACK40V_03530 [Anaerolineales bacterium]
MKPAGRFYNGEGDSVTVTEEQVQGLQTFLEALIQYGDEDLQSVISAELEKHPLESLIGVTMDEAWSHINGYDFEWLSPIVIQIRMLLNREVQFLLSFLFPILKVILWKMKQFIYKLQIQMEM